MVIRDLLTRGLLAGLIAAFLALGVAELLGEPQVSKAISVETKIDRQAGITPTPAVVSRDVQSTAGLATGVLVVGTALGGIFGLGFAFAYGRLGRISIRATAIVVAAIGFAAFYLVPFLKYPANPPSVGQPATIDHRTALYFGMMLISIVLVVGSVVLARRLSDRLGAWNASIAVLVGFLAVIGVVYWLMPGVNEVPAVFPAVTLFRFRLASIVTQLTLWMGIGALFGFLTDRSQAGRLAALRG